jgi:hypothetical protein
MLILGSAAMLHDAAITAFGHLVEEALRYIGKDFNHEEKLTLLFSAPDKTELGGIDAQVYLGYQANVRPWANKSFERDADVALEEILDAMRGKGRWGTFISNDIDLDNLDNLVRMAYHMGLTTERDLPHRIAETMTEGSSKQGRIFTDRSIEPIKDWLELRRRVYSHLMLSRPDFVGKSMLIYSVVTAYESGNLGSKDQVWQLTDRELLGRLMECKNKDVSATVRAWLVNDLWPLADLMWLEGEPPEFTRLKEFCDAVSCEMHRPCFAYRIQDKQTRKIQVFMESKDTVELGYSPTRWLLGITSRKRESFSRSEHDRLKDIACEFFDTTYFGKASEPETEVMSLFG